MAGATVHFMRDNFPVSIITDLKVPDFNWNKARVWFIEIERQPDGSEIDDSKVRKLHCDIPHYNATIYLASFIEAQTNIRPIDFWIPGQYTVVLKAERSSPDTKRYEGLLTTFFIQGDNTDQSNAKQISDAFDLFCELFPDCKEHCMTHRDEIIRCISSSTPPAYGSHLRRIQMPEPPQGNRFGTLSANSEFHELLPSECQLAIITVVVDFVGLLMLLAGIRVTKKLVLAGQEAAPLIPKLGGGLRAQIAAINRASSLQKAKAIAALLSGTKNVFKEIFVSFSLVIRYEYDWWDWTLTTITALVTITGWFGSAGALLGAQIALSFTQTAELVKDSINAENKCS